MTMDRLNHTTGLRSIPKTFAPVFLDPTLSQAFTEAAQFLRQAPSPWGEVEELPVGPGIHPQDVPFGAKPVTLSLAEQDRGRERINQAYRRIELALRQLDRRIGQLRRSKVRRLLIVLGALLVLTSVGLLVFGVFRHSEIVLTGKDGAATVLLGTGIAILTASYRLDQKMHTLASRLRVRLAACLGRADYVEVHNCFSRTLEELDNAFATIRSRVEATPGQSSDVPL